MVPILCHPPIKNTHEASLHKCCYRLPACRPTASAANSEFIEKEHAFIGLLSLEKIATVNTIAII